MIKAEIITIGDEILLGQTIDTNSAWLGQELHLLGIHVGQITSISDTTDQIKNSLQRAIPEFDLVIITGGLGPTRDDRTKTSLSDFFQMPLVEDESVLSHIKQLLGGRQVPLNELNQQQALIPRGCQVLLNDMGTAPGMWFDQGNCAVIALPGVPFEMKGICQKVLFPKLIEKYQLVPMPYRMIMTTGYPESVLAKRIENWEMALPEGLSLAYLPSPGMVKLRLSASAALIGDVDQVLEVQINLLLRIIPKAIYSIQNQSLPEVVGGLLKKYGKQVGSAESCTGGKIAHMITSIPGSSQFFKGSVLAYAYETKRDLLGIPQQLLNSAGAVSEEVVRAMAENARHILQVDYAIATSGIAGPDGGTESKPVGTIWVAVSSGRQTKTALFNFGQHRGRNITRASMAALNMLRLMIQSEYGELRAERDSKF